MTSERRTVITQRQTHRDRVEREIAEKVRRMREGLFANHNRDPKEVERLEREYARRLRAGVQVNKS